MFLNVHLIILYPYKSYHSKKKMEKNCCNNNNKKKRRKLCACYFYQPHTHPVGYDVFLWLQVFVF